MDAFLDMQDSEASYWDPQWPSGMEIDGLPRDDLFTNAYLPDNGEQEEAGSAAEMTGINTEKAGAPIPPLPQQVSSHGDQTTPTQGTNYLQAQDPWACFDWTGASFNATKTPQSDTKILPIPDSNKLPTSQTYPSRITQTPSGWLLNMNLNTNPRQSPWSGTRATRNSNNLGFNRAHANAAERLFAKPLHPSIIGSNSMARAGAMSKNPRQPDPMQRVSHRRAVKRRQDASLRYQTETTTPKAWGSLIYNDQHLFSYTDKGQWLLDRSFDASQLREYMTACPKGTILWLQQAPTQSTHRLDPEDRVCRWVDCPVSNRKITTGWLRVAFDESPALTSNGTKDPLKVAGSMHLWCFEQIFDPLEFHMSGRLRPEHRQLPNEDKSVVTLEKLTDVGIIREAYLPWIEGKTREWRAKGPLKGPRPHEETLSYALTRFHLENQTAARQKARMKRNEYKIADERKTIDVHMGDLEVYVDACKKAKNNKKQRRLSDVRNGRTGAQGAYKYVSQISGQQQQEQQARLRMLPSRHSLSTIQPHGNVKNSMAQPTQECMTTPLALITPPRLAHGSALSTAPSPAMLQTRTSGNGRDPRSSNAGVMNHQYAALTSRTPLQGQGHPLSGIRQKQRQVVHQTSAPNWDSCMMHAGAFSQSRRAKRLMHTDPLDSPSEQDESRAKRRRISYHGQSSATSIGGEDHSRSPRGSSVGPGRNATLPYPPPPSPPPSLPPYPPLLSKDAHDAVNAGPLEVLGPQGNQALSRSEAQDKDVRQSHIDVNAQGNPGSNSDILDPNLFQAQPLEEKLQESNAGTTTTTTTTTNGSTMRREQGGLDYNSWQPGNIDADVKNIIGSIITEQQQMSTDFEGIWNHSDIFTVDGLDLTDMFGADDHQDKDAFNPIPAAIGDADDVNRTDQTDNGVTGDGPSSNQAG